MSSSSSSSKYEEDKSYERIPVWDGTAVGMIQFEKDIKWWLAEISDIENIRYKSQHAWLTSKRVLLRNVHSLLTQSSFGINPAIGQERMRTLCTFVLIFAMESTG